MNKEFIPYEEALALKELGFDEACFAAYSEDENNSSLFIYWNDLVNMSDLFISQDNCEKFDYECLAPTFSQAFRWFREKYGLFSEIQPYLIIGTQWRYTITNRNNSSGLPHKEGFQTYEEAELACLKKLIEIIKK